MSDFFNRLAVALADRYALERELGTGGMATVYEAEDLKHHRRVAIKVLKPELAAILGADRFLKEIEVTANLQHPHILPLHDSGQADGLLFYVMPLVEGGSLRDRLNRETQLPVDDAIAIARAVASGLDYAHRKDVVHRDIKPENILLHDGQPVVSDFGIALAVSAAGGTRLTETGISLGTPTYMSPEQAAADREIDARSDIYSLGCVAYEMLVGEPPFTGPTAQAIVARVLTEQPRTVASVRETTPGHVDAAIRRALKKLPADRPQTAAEFAAAFGNGTVRVQAETASAPRRFGLPIAIAIATGAVGLAIGASLRPAAPVLYPPAVHNPIGLQPAEYLGHGGFRSFYQRHSRTAFALSPDGTMLVYVGADSTGTRLYVRNLGELTARPLADTDGAVGPFFSPDGESIGFWADSALKRIPVAGGPALELAAIAWPAGATWGPDNTIVIGLRGRLFTLPADGGVPEPITTLDSTRGEVYHGLPHFLPDGNALLFTVLAAGGWNTATVEVLTLSDGGRTVVVENGTDARYAPTGHLLFVRSGTLMAAPFDMTTHRVTGGVVPMIEGVRQAIAQVWDQASTGAAQYSISEAGSLVYALGPSRSDIRRSLLLVTRDGVPDSLDIAPRRLTAVRLHPDGHKVAMSILSEGNSDIYVHDLISGTWRQLTRHPGRDNYPVWIEGGARLAFVSDRDGLPSIYAVADELTAVPERLTPLDGTPAGWNGESRVLTFVRNGDIWVLPEGGEPELFYELVNSNRTLRPEFSPDGRWIAFSSDASGLDQVYLIPYPGPGQAVPVSTDGGWAPTWSPSGSELYYYNRSTGDDELTMMAVEIQTAPRLHAGNPRRLFRGYYRHSMPASYDVAPDGRFLMVREQPEPTGEITELGMVVNWFAELRARVPARR